MAVQYLLVAAVLLAAGLPAAQQSDECTAAEKFAGICGDRVVLIDTETIDGYPSSIPADTGVSEPPPIIGRDALCWIANQTNPSVCIATPTDSIPTITTRDIATFIPTPGRQQMEPDGWTVAGLDTNFYAITGQHVANGTLLGRPADVRFTPTSYLWAYGDGTSATRNTMGGTWAAQGIAEFEPTPTSHVYDELGDYTITLDIVFTAEYRFAGGPWRPVVGTITLPANDLYLRVGTAKTVLVEHDCQQNPVGPGC
jgi:hypothetical protein